MHVVCIRPKRLAQGRERGPCGINAKLAPTCNGARSARRNRNRTATRWCPELLSDFLPD